MPSPFFIVGSGRCGSTWLHHILSRHPKLALTNEAGVIDCLYTCNLLASTSHTGIVDLPTRGGAQVRGLVHEDEIEAFTPLFTAHVKTICEEFYRQRFADRDYAWWGDKLPDPRAALSARYLWPDVRYLVLVRDPRDVLVSWRAHASREHIAKVFPEVVDLDATTLARSWDAIYRGLLRELEAPLVIRYEDVRADPEPHIQAILDHLDLAPHPDLRAAIEAKDLLAKHGTSGSAKSSFGRWHNELAPADIATIENHCAENMRRFGYPLTGVHR